MDNLVGVHDLFDEVSGFLIVHGPDLLDTLVISNFKFFKAFLEFDELVGEQLVLLSVVHVPVFGLSLLNFELDDLLTELLRVLVQLRLETLHLLGEDQLPLGKDVIVKTELLLVQLVNGFHVLHALLKNLHFSFQLDLLFRLLVGVLTHHIFKLLGILLLLLLPLIQVVGLDLLVLLKQLLDLKFIAI